MNLLVTNTRNAQAYAIIRALRPHSEKIVVTMYGKNRFGARLSHAANSRLVDSRFYVPSPVEDWRAGRIQRENTGREEAYIQAVMRICEKEKIDTIFPSFDPHVYVFSKNKERFEKMGVLIPIPDYETVITPLDKYRTIQAAQEVSFPCPRTYLPESEEDLRKIADELGFPLVIKPRFSAGGRGTEIVRDLPELLENAHSATDLSSHMIQEYIPGKQEENLTLVLDTKGVLKMTFAYKRVRHFFRLQQNFATVFETLGSHPYTMQAARLGQKIGWWGSVTIQVKIDLRDGVPKLMEINPRLGAGLWLRVVVGINEPLMCLKLAKREAVETTKDYPPETIFLNPIEDLLALAVKLIDLLVYRFRINFQGRTPVDPLNPPPAVKQLMTSYMGTYFNRKKKVYSLYFTHFVRDPWSSITWWLQALTSVWRSVKEFGK